MARRQGQTLLGVPNADHQRLHDRAATLVGPASGGRPAGAPRCARGCVRRHPGRLLGCLRSDDLRAGRRADGGRGDGASAELHKPVGDVCNADPALRSPVLMQSGGWRRRERNGAPFNLNGRKPALGAFRTSRRQSSRVSCTSRSITSPSSSTARDGQNCRPAIISATSSRCPWKVGQWRLRRRKGSRIRSRSTTAQFARLIDQGQKGRRID